MRYAQSIRNAYRTTTRHFKLKSKPIRRYSTRFTRKSKPKSQLNLGGVQTKRAKSSWGNWGNWGNWSNWGKSLFQFDPLTFDFKKLASATNRDITQLLSSKEGIAHLQKELLRSKDSQKYTTKIIDRIKNNIQHTDTFLDFIQTSNSHNFLNTLKKNNFVENFVFFQSPYIEVATSIKHFSQLAKNKNAMKNMKLLWQNFEAQRNKIKEEINSELNSYVYYRTKLGEFWFKEFNLKDFFAKHFGYKHKKQKYYHYRESKQKQQSYNKREQQQSYNRREHRTYQKSTTQDPYTTLKVKPNASKKEIKQGYYKLAQKYHPDRAPADKKQEYEKIMKKINNAYEQVKNKW